jgi:hypothetical protein
MQTTTTKNNKQTNKTKQNNKTKTNKPKTTDLNVNARSLFISQQN